MESKSPSKQIQFQDSANNVEEVEKSQSKFGVAVRDDYRWWHTWISLSCSFRGLRSCSALHCCLYWPLLLLPSRCHHLLLWRRLVGHRHLVHGESNDLGPQVSDQVTIELALKLTQEETSEPHDDGRHQHYHFRPQWWMRGESQLYFSSNALSRHTFKVCSLKYSRPGHCSTGSTPFLPCCDGNGRDGLAVVRGGCRGHHGGEGEEFSGGGWIVEPDKSC